MIAGSLPASDVCRANVSLFAGTLDVKLILLACELA